MPNPYMATSLPEHQVAELHRLMNEEIEEVAVFFMDPLGFITVWNRAAEVMKGYTAVDAIGSHLSILYTEEQRDNNWPEHNLNQARQHGFYKEETWRRRKDGTLFWARISLTALFDKSGRHIGFSKITVDLTDHKHLESCLKERETTRRILQAANAGTWSWNPDTNEVEVSTSLSDLLDLHHLKGALSFAQWLQLFHAADRELIERKFAETRARGPGSRFSTEARMCQRDGQARWFFLQADWYRELESEPFLLSGVNVDIQELKTASEDLQSAVEKLRDADARKDEFLAMLAHELRNPLAPIRSAAELLKISQLDEARVRKTSEIIARQVDHMTGLVDDLMDVSRVTRGLVNLDRQPLDVRRILTDAVEQVSPLIRARRHRLALHHSPREATVMGDHKRLVQVVGNLLNNAAKYTPEGGSIALKTEVDDDKVFISVCDDGIGMKPELVGRVFDLFTQAERTPDRSSGGMGLGLALVKSLVELHGGSVASSSQGLGSGSTFKVSLPLAGHGHSQMRAPTSESSMPGNRLRILIVDDNADAAQMLAMYLEAHGHDVHVEYQALAAIERARHAPPDVFLLDIGLPDIDGYELARRLIDQPNGKNALLIALTGYGQEHDRKAAMDAGFRHHLVKPVDPGKLVALLGEAATRGD